MSCKTGSHCIALTHWRILGFLLLQHKNFFSLFLMWEFYLLDYFLGLFFNILPFGLEPVIEGLQYFEDWLFWRQNTSSLHSRYWTVTTSALPISLHCKGHSLSSKKALPPGWSKAESARDWESSRCTCYSFSSSFSSCNFNGSDFTQWTAHIKNRAA